MTKQQLIKEHLLEHGSITSWEAIQRYSATRLAAVIFNLRKTMDIDTLMVERTDKYGNRTQYAKYVLKGNKDE